MPCEISVIIPTDTWGTVRPVVECYRRQTARDRIELIIVAPVPDVVAVALAELPEFARAHVVSAPEGVSLAGARAFGVRAARAPLAFLGETHTFPDPVMVEALLRADTGAHGVLVPAVSNANPGSALSWAALLTDYGAWIDGREGGETEAIPLYNAAFRRSLLLDLGEDLDGALEQGDALVAALRARGVRAWLEPTARISHLNVARPRAWLHERFIAGRLFAASRGRRWSWGRRVVYLVGSPLVPLLMTRRILPIMRDARRRARLPAFTLPALVLGFAARALGEMLGYAVGARESDGPWMAEYEVRKALYAGDPSGWVLPAGS